MFKAPY